MRPSFNVKVISRHRDFKKKKFRKENFKAGIVVAGGEFLSYWNHKIIKFDEEKRFGL